MHLVPPMCYCELCFCLWRRIYWGRGRRTFGIEKSFISLFMMTPVVGTMSPEPKMKLMVLVKLIAIPEASAAAI